MGSLAQDRGGRIIQSVARALDVLELLSEHHREMGVTEIAGHMALNKSSVHGLVSTLHRRGFLDQNPANGKYRLGLRLLEIGFQVKDAMDLAQLAEPLIRDLVNEYRETAHLVTLDQGEVVYIYKLESPESIRMCSQVGRRLPVHCTGVGKAMAAFLPREELDSILDRRGLPPRTPHTITDRQAFLQELERVRSQGVAYDREEVEEGLKCVAAPIFDHQGQVVAALSLAGPAHRIDAKAARLVEAVRASAGQVSSRLGYRGGRGQQNQPWAPSSSPQERCKVPEQV